MVEKDQQLSALEPGELELFVDHMQPWAIDKIGNQGWVDWHIRLQKLNQQAVLEAASMQEELTKETLISYGKLPVLVHEAICIRVWREKIYPQILKLNPAPQNTFGVYMVLYHEAVAVGLLETVFFHEDGAQCASDVLIDLLDYAVEQLTALVVLLNSDYLQAKPPKDLETETTVEELGRQKTDLQFDISTRCVSIVRYIAEHMEASNMGVSIATNMYACHDLPSLLAHLIQHRPWTRTNLNGDVETFNFGRWSAPDESTGMHRMEAQLWLCLRQLLLEPRMAHHYTIDDTRRTAFCRIQSHLTDEMLDEVPPLGELKMFLCRLAVGDYSSIRTNGARNPGCTLIEVVPQIKDTYLKQVQKRTKSIAKTQLADLCMDGSTESRQMARKLLESYTSDAALVLEGGGAKCAKCGGKAAKKCSRCKTEWYCGRECQVQQWPRHKDICDQLVNLLIEE